MNVHTPNPGTIVDNAAAFASATSAIVTGTITGSAAGAAIGAFAVPVPLGAVIGDVIGAGINDCVYFLIGAFTLIWLSVETISRRLWAAYAVFKTDKA